MDIRGYLEKNKLIIDGAMGTYYAGLENNTEIISEWANLKGAEKIKKIHLEYMVAGARMIRTNSFAASRSILSIDKDKQKEILCKAYGIAVEAVKEFGQEVFVAADIGPIPENAFTLEEEILEEYKYMCDVFIEEKTEILLFETFSDLKYIRPLVKYIKEKNKGIFVITNFCLNKNGYTKSGISASRLLEEVGIIQEIDGCGFNCGIGSGHLSGILKNLEFPEGKYSIAVPNAGYPENLQNRMVFMDNARYFAENMKSVAQLGVDMIGGCCGTTPEYIKLLAEKIDIKNIEKRAMKAPKKEEKDKVELRENKFYSLFCQKIKVIAVELDPPFDASYDKIMQAAHELKQAGTDIITFADSPMGRSRADSILMSVKIAREVEIPVMPHVCCRDKNLIAMRSGLLGAYINGIRNLLIVTGDPVPNESRSSTTGVFDYNSIQLMDFVKEMNQEHFSEEPIYYGGALNYGRGNIDKVIERMKKKIAGGAKYFLTQPIYAEEDIERIAYIKKHVDTKLMCGIMPLVSYRNAQFIKNEITGIYVPDSIIERYSPDMTKEEAEKTGGEIASELVEKLNPYSDGYYFMLPFNRTSLMEKIKMGG